MLKLRKQPNWMTLLEMSKITSDIKVLSSNQERQTVYCAFHKHANSKVQKPPSQLRFYLSSIIITITSNEP